MRPAKNFAQNKMLAFQLEKLYISFLEVPETYSKEISLEKNKTKQKNKKKNKKNKNKKNKQTNKKTKQNSI